MNIDSVLEEEITAFVDADECALAETSATVSRPGFANLSSMYTHSIHRQCILACTCVQCTNDRYNYVFVQEIRCWPPDDAEPGDKEVKVSCIIYLQTNTKHTILQFIVASSSQCNSTPPG